ncbi:MAG: DUF362 domain-containing protein [Planctomycetaceae bacterium]|nr:DUF362 domain-containing protein [Planctomycetaceae bacterium]
MNRKEFLKTLGVAGTAAAVGNFDALDVFAQDTTGTPDLVAVSGGEPDVMFQKAIAELGGMGRFVKKGQKIVIKPNIAWDKTPEIAANTNPVLVAEIVKQALAAGAAEVNVFDFTCDKVWQDCYKHSGIEDAVIAAGGKMLPGNDERYFKEVELPQGKILKTTKIHQALLDCDAWINVPVLKVHRGTKMTIAMKNYMGIVWDRQYFHGHGLDQCIADVCTWSKKPVLNVVDAYRIMKANGPKGVSVADAVLVKSLLLSTDIVAVDAAATKLAQQFTNVPLEQVQYIHFGEEFKLGTTKLDTLNVKKIAV